MRVRWSRPAADDLRGIRQFIRRDSPAAAQRVAQTILARCELLCDFPERGRIGDEPGTRELVFAPLPYVATYRISGEVIEILHVWHGAEDWQAKPTP